MLKPIVFIVVIMLSLLAPLPTLISSPAATRTMYGIYLRWRVYFDNDGNMIIDERPEKLLLGIPWRVFGYASGFAGVLPSLEDFFPNNESVPVIYVYASSDYEIDNSKTWIWDYIRWAMGNGSIVIVNQYSIKAFNNTLFKVYGTFTRQNYTCGPGWWIDGYLRDIRDVQNATELIVSETGVPVFFIVQYHQGKLIYYPKATYSAGLLKHVVDTVRGEVYQVFPVSIKGYIYGKNMLMYRIDDLFPLMDENNWENLKYYVNTYFKGTSRTLLVSSPGLGCPFDEPQLYTGDPPGYNVSSSYPYVWGQLRTGHYFIIYDDDSDGLYDKLRIDLNNNTDFIDDPIYTFGQEITINYNGINVKYVWTNINNDNGAPSKAWFGANNTIADQFNPEIIPTVKNWINNGYVQVAPHGWNHWATRLPGGLTEVYKPGTKTVLSPDEIYTKLKASYNELVNVFGKAVKVDVRPFGSYGIGSGQGSGDYINFATAISRLRRDNIVLISLGAGGTGGYFDNVFLGNALFIESSYVDTEKEVNDQLYKNYLLNIPIQVSTHTYESPSILDRIVWYINYVENHRDQYAEVKPSTYVSTWTSYLNIVTSPWNITITSNKITIRFPGHYNGMYIRVPRKPGKEILVEGGHRVHDEKDYHIVSVESNTVVISYVDPETYMINVMQDFTNTLATILLQALLPLGLMGLVLVFISKIAR